MGLIDVDFALGPRGTPMPDDFVTREGLHVVLPQPSTLQTAVHRIGLRIDNEVTLIPPEPLASVSLLMHTGSSRPAISFLAHDGTLLYYLKPTPEYDGSVRVFETNIGEVHRIMIRFPGHEGTLLSLAGCSIKAAAEHPENLAAPLAAPIDKLVCQAIVYAETGTIETTTEGLPGLAQARQFIAAVAYKRNGNGVAKPKYPTPEQLKQPFIKKAWDRCLTAAEDGQGMDVGTCKHFVIWYSDDAGKTPSKKPTRITDDWPYTQTDKISGHWGPYKVNELGKDNIYVIKYCGVP